MARAGAALGLISCIACIGASPLPLPQEASESRSALIGVETDHGAELVAIDLAEGRFPVITIGEQPIYLVLYEAELAVLQIPPGRLMPLSEVEDGRPLPSGSTWMLPLPEETWSPIAREALPASIREFRLPDLPIGQCEESGGCFRVRDAEEYCQVPCVEPVGADPMPPRMAELPAPPVFAPCPEGWREVPPDAEREEVLCVPVSPTDCGFAGARHYLGDEVCSTAGGVCPEGDYAEALPPGTRRYVRAGGNGSGTPDAPFGSIQSAIDASSDGDVIVVGKGTYTQPITIDRRVSLVGACAETLVRAPITVSSDASLSSIAVAPGFASVAVRVQSGATATLSEVAVSSAAIGLDVIGSVRGGRITIDAIRGIEVAGDAELDRTTVRLGVLTGVRVSGSAMLTNLRVSSSSTALATANGGTLIARGVYLVSNLGGVVARDGTIEIDRALIARSTRDALIAAPGGTLTARRIHLADDYQSLHVIGGAAVLEDAYLDRPSMQNAQISRGTMTLRRAVLARSRRFGIHATGGNVQLEDVQIRDNDPSVQDGEGMVINGAVVLEARRLSIERVFDFGIRVLSTNTKAELRIDDLTMREVGGAVGYGIEMGRTAAPAIRSTLTINRFFAENIDRFAVRTVSGEANEINDLILRDLPSGGVSSVGGVLTIHRAELSRILGPSLSVTSGEMVLDDLRIVAPENGLVTEGWLLTDVSAVDSAMNVNRFDISGASGAGVLIRQFSRMMFGAGRITGNRVGVEVRADGFLYSRLEGDVIYRNNVEGNLLKLGQVAR